MSQLSNLADFSSDFLFPTFYSLELYLSFRADFKYNGSTWEKIYKTGKAGKEITELTYIGEL
ncbi:hypothetical protein AFK68_01405, partial [Hydrocoleum sp. CS-953]|uniref:hypothetical protein n=1 Tax=Hydrocoleum sp. CS-953 TaxID=1671698 RepID=UPI000BC42E26